MSKNLAHQINTMIDTLASIRVSEFLVMPLYLEADETMKVLASAWIAPIRDLHRHTSHLVIGDLIAEVIAARLAARQKREAERKAKERACFTLEARANLRT